MEVADGDEVAVVIASVRHSQKLSATPVKPWIAAMHNGKLVCAYCTRCMAGLGEAWSHIAALLFAMEANTRYRNTCSDSCTSELCCHLALVELSSTLQHQIWISPLRTQNEYDSTAS